MSRSANASTVKKFGCIFVRPLGEWSENNVATRVANRTRTFQASLMCEDARESSRDRDEVAISSKNSRTWPRPCQSMPEG